MIQPLWAEFIFLFSFKRMWECDREPFCGRDELLNALPFSSNTNSCLWHRNNYKVTGKRSQTVGPASIIPFLIHGTDSGKCCVMLQTLIQNFPNKVRELDSDTNPRMKLSSLINCTFSCFPTFDPLAFWPPLPPPWLKLLPQTFGAESATPARPNDKYSERCGVACGINASCGGRVNRCLEVAAADKAANLVTHISDRRAVSPHTNVAYRYANTFP